MPKLLKKSYKKLKEDESEMSERTSNDEKLDDFKKSTPETDDSGLKIGLPEINPSVIQSDYNGDDEINKLKDGRLSDWVQLVINNEYHQAKTNTGEILKTFKMGIGIKYINCNLPTCKIIDILNNKLEPLDWYASLDTISSSVFSGIKHHKVFTLSDFPPTKEIFVRLTISTDPFKKTDMYYRTLEKIIKSEICKTCNQNPSKIVYNPCGHLILCEECPKPNNCSICTCEIKTYKPGVCTFQEKRVLNLEKPNKDDKVKDKSDEDDKSDHDEGDKSDEDDKPDEGDKSDEDDKSSETDESEGNEDSSEE